jgi:hypothetical protein
MKMKGAALLAAVLMLLAFVHQPADAGMEIGVGINIGLPLVTFAEPPEMVVIPGSYVYYVPNIQDEVFFYQGIWYRHWGDGWRSSRDYNGPWGYVGPRYVPRPFLRLPPGYRQWAVHERVRYNDLNTNWRRWEKERYWEKKHDWWREKRELHRDRQDARRDRTIIRQNRQDAHRDRQDAHRDSKDAQRDRTIIRQNRQDAVRDRQDVQRDRKNIEQNRKQARPERQDAQPDRRDRKKERQGKRPDEDSGKGKPDSEQTGQ